MLAAQQNCVFHLGRADRIPAHGVFLSAEMGGQNRHFIVARAAGRSALTSLRQQILAATRGRGTCARNAPGRSFQWSPTKSPRDGRGGSAGEAAPRFPAKGAVR
ncbi:hypothetical protein [Mangrovicoccus ximenensis]|uniref:hypothetical protein n=1 Tax=Mangrovicoccus ximenensis TaxID=1911570 RepID=UPI000D3B5AEF|nr:hypothetical protein [Mangrovicoccus ximenensis]